MITSRRHPFKFFLTIAVCFLFFAAIGSFMIYMYFDLSEKGEVELETLFIPVIGIAFFFMAFYSVRQYVLHAPKITVDKYTISFGTEKYNLTNIKEIFLTGKMPFRFLIKFPMEGALIVFKDNKEKYIFNDMYLNTWQIKSFLEKTVIEDKNYQETENRKIRSNAIRFQKTEDFKGQQGTSLRGVSLWGLIILFLFMIFSEEKVHSNEFWLFFLGFSSFWFFLNSWLMHYFSLTNEYLIIKNHNLIWRQQIYKLADIKEVTFETHGQMPNCLRIITNDYKDKLYPAGTLRDKRWLEFEKRLQNKGIRVRNECI